LKTLLKFAAKIDKEYAHSVSKPQMDRTLNGPVRGPKHRTNFGTFVLCLFGWLTTMKFELPKIHRTWGSNPIYFTWDFPGFCRHPVGWLYPWIFHRNNMRFHWLVPWNPSWTFLRGVCLQLEQCTFVGLGTSNVPSSTHIRVFRRHY